MNAVICGYGIVGKATALAFGIQHYYDLLTISSQLTSVPLDQVHTFRYIFICLPTPTVFGDCFTEDIEKIVKAIVKKKGNNIFIIRSTVVPGTTQHIAAATGARIVSNPEFLSEKTWEQDAQHPSMIVVGSDDTEAREEVAALYRGRFKYIEPLVTDATTAEFIKYALNVFFAVKVMYANELYDYAKDIGANYETIKSVLEKHPWGSKNHFQAVYNGKRGIGGHCLPKDLEAFARITDSPLLKQIHAMNRRFLKG